MKISSFLLILFLIQLSINGQIDKTDSLITKINNSQLYGTCHYAWVLEMKSSAGEELIKIGYPTISKLIPYLDDKDKGIIAHYIITMIYGVYRYSYSFDHLHKDSIVDYDFNGLRFFERINNIYTYDSILIKNKKQWIEKVKNDILVNYKDTSPLKKSDLIKIREK